MVTALAIPCSGRGRPWMISAESGRGCRIHPWGLSGPGFLWLYIAGLVIGLAVAIGARMRVRRPRLVEPPAALDAAELGFLGGGPENAVQVAVVRLFESGVVRANRSGQLSAASSAKPTGQPLDDAVLGELTKPRMVTALAGGPRSRTRPPRSAIRWSGAAFWSRR